MLASGARLALVVAFTVSAVSKLRGRRELPAQMRAFGVPASLAKGVAVIVPAAELTVAVGLAAFGDSPVPAFVALGLLALFTGAVIANVGRDDPPPCPCFGMASADQPVSVRTIVANGWLMGLAVIATGSDEWPDAAAGLLAFAVGAAMLAVYVALALGYGRRRRATRQ